MNTQTDPHSGLHSEQGAVAGEHPGRTQPGPGALQELRTVVSALRGDNEFDVQRLRGLLKGARS